MPQQRIVFWSALLFFSAVCIGLAGHVLCGCFVPLAPHINPVAGEEAMAGVFLGLLFSLGRSGSKQRAPKKTMENTEPSNRNGNDRNIVKTRLARLERTFLSELDEAETEADYENTDTDRAGDEISDHTEFEEETVEEEWKEQELQEEQSEQELQEINEEKSEQELQEEKSEQELQEEKSEQELQEEQSEQELQEEQSEQEEQGEPGKPAGSVLKEESEFLTVLDQLEDMVRIIEAGKTAGAVEAEGVGEACEEDETGEASDAGENAGLLEIQEKAGLAREAVEELQEFLIVAGEKLSFLKSLFADITDIAKSRHRD